MRLLDTTTLKLKTFEGDEKPKYAILSHTWGDDEVLFKDLRSKSSIDKSSSSELSEAINSMFKWYLDSLICYAYLSDVLSTDVRDPQNGIVPFEGSRWFKRGWTAPAKVVFFDKSWSYVGRRDILAEKIHRITGIDEKILRYCNARHIFDEIGTISVHTKMVWARCRMTTRVEDRAYSLMGLFDVNMPLLYGEGGVKAFQRLQYEIVKSTKDQSILLHSGNVYSNHLATSPDDFTPLHEFLKGRSDLTFQTIGDYTNVSLGFCPTQDVAPGIQLFWGIVAAYFGDDPLRLDQPAILLYLDGEDGLCSRFSRTIYRVRHGDEGQMEIVDETGKRVDVLQHDLARRKVVRLSSLSNLPGIAESHIRILAHGAVISIKPPPRPSYELGQSSLVACVLLQNVELNLDPSLAILIFKQSTILFPYLVDMKITSQCKNPTDSDLFRVLLTLGTEYDQNSGNSIVMSSGMQVTAWIREQMFFEDTVYHLHVEVNQQSTI
ncbi:hypothetical protein FHL15_005698 [Xylaria flabelliformis]|uniref:Heterokaryon incompatibility domain-containing protein n=1 Tax=Xylaria flabelliformis TaxID=2512241 RepID=A0A553HZP8_9PEZI|nr:hypothetical protein FHL15_005698 [Xylaria flabelliformis]